MTEAEEFADAHGLSLDEAEVILARRARASSPTKLSPEKLQRAMAALMTAQKKVGVHPVVVQDGEVAKAYDEEAKRNLDRFYASKGCQERPMAKRHMRAPVADEDVSQDPEDY